jgi:hypothetical protein
MWDGEFINDKLTGKQIEYDINGNPKTKYYKNGVIY